MISYKLDAKAKNVKVYNGKKHVGDIKKVLGGFQYYPKGYKISDGEVFLTLAGCQRSLEG